MQTVKVLPGPDRLFRRWK